MKKTLLYILIITALMGSGGNTNQAEAAGKCWRTDQGAAIPGVSEDACKRMCAAPAAKCTWVSDSSETSTPTPLESNNITVCPEGQVLGANNTCVDTTTNYIFLQPLPCKEGMDGCIYNSNTKSWELKYFDPTSKNEKGEIDSLGKYLNMLIVLFIGICAVLAVIMIVMGGIEYMTTELISSKEAGKERITNAIFGLVLAMGSWLILNTINPNLLKSDLNISEVAIEVNLFEKESTVASSGINFTLTGSPSAGVSEFVNQKLKNSPLYAITVDTSTNRAYFYVGNDWKTFVSVPINVGYKGVSEVGAGVANDKKTPKGNWTIGATNLANGDKAVLVSGGKYNVGAAFIDIGTGRGIGFHGSATNHLGTTAGCIRMTNDDLRALAPYMKSGVKVIIK